jgi:uncharacterized protein (DUF427 family)
MSKSPGHLQHPDHKVLEKHSRDHFQVTIDGKIIAESNDVIEVDEDESPPRFYFPRSDVKMDLLDRTDTTTKCPFKGAAHYYSIKEGDKTLGDAVWTYEEPFEEHQDLRGRLAFLDEGFRDIKIEKIAG